MIAGRDAVTHGEAKNSWLTGTAAWTFVALSQYILGIRPEYDGLRIAPCIPKSWEGFTVTRKFRGATYEIAMRQKVGSTGKNCALCVDGTPIGGDIIPPAPSGSTVRVEVEIS